MKFVFIFVCCWSSLGWSSLAFSNSKNLKDNLKKEKSLVYSRPSLMETLNKTSQLKNSLKRDLAKSKINEVLEITDEVEKSKKLVRFGNLSITISERKKEDLTKIKR